MGWNRLDVTNLVYSHIGDKTMNKKLVIWYNEPVFEQLKTVAKKHKIKYADLISVMIAAYKDNKICPFIRIKATPNNTLEKAKNFSFSYNKDESSDDPFYNKLIEMQASRKLSHFILTIIKKYIVFVETEAQEGFTEEWNKSYEYYMFGIENVSASTVNPIEPVISSAITEIEVPTIPAKPTVPATPVSNYEKKQVEENAEATNKIKRKKMSLR